MPVNMITPLLTLCPEPTLGPGGSVGGGCGNMDLILTDRQLDPQASKTWGGGLDTSSITFHHQLRAAEGTDTAD